MGVAAEGVEAVAELGGQVCLVEVAEPLRVGAAVGSVEGLFCVVQGGGAGSFVVGFGQGVGLHDVGFGGQDGKSGAVGGLAGGVGEVEAGGGVTEVGGLVAHRGEDLRAEAVVCGSVGEVQGEGEVPLGDAVLGGVVRLPAGELGQFGGGAE